MMVVDSLMALNRADEVPEHLMRDGIHYGCGKNIMDGWLNVDAFDQASYPDGTVDPEIARKTLAVDLTCRHPFHDNAFRFGFSEDFLEHLDQAESLVFLSECYRTLAKGGVVRLSFPDLRNVLKRHFRSSDYEGASKGTAEAYTMWGHKHFYCLESLELVSRHIGFEDVVSVEYGESTHEALRGLETRQDQIGLNLIVELAK